MTKRAKKLSSMQGGQIDKCFGILRVNSDPLEYPDLGILHKLADINLTRNLHSKTEVL